MEMEMEVPAATEADLGHALTSLNARLNAAASLLEEAAQRFAGFELNASVPSPREQQLEQRLAEAETTIASLRAEAARAEAVRASARKTAPAGVSALASREGAAVESSALDASLRSLSIEQRIAVKSEMLRAGLLS
jgi:hypothetical protein